MYLYVDTAKGKRKDRSNEKTIKRGEKCLVIHNGRIGPYQKSSNINKTDAIEMLKKLITELESCPIKRKESISAYDFSADDIPF